jgi:GTP-binding protein
MKDFVDEVEIRVVAGDGGAGCVAFRREKSAPLGGPAGGDGGKGGAVVLVADERVRTLLDLRAHRLVRAPGGEPGRGKQQNGKAGEDRRVAVPVGTLVRDASTGDVLADLTQVEQVFVAARGGQGGRGNMHFASPTNHTPRESDPGEPGESRTLKLELKLMADVGLLGFPNVGKSTLLARVTRSRTRVAAYPFTTLSPHLGVCQLPDHRAIVIADIPGLLEGASEGHGLGYRFLRHLERTRVLLHLVDASLSAYGDPLTAYHALGRELAAYGDRLASLPQVVALGKLDLPEVAEQYPELRAAFLGAGIELRAFSAVTGEGVPELLECLYRVVIDRSRTEVAEDPGDPS